MGGAGGRWQKPIKYLSLGNRETRLAYRWTCTRPVSDTVFHWETSRAAKCLRNIVPAEWACPALVETLRVNPSPRTCWPMRPRPRLPIRCG